jgi:hypothetical protein
MTRGSHARFALHLLFTSILPKATANTFQGSVANRPFREPRPVPHPGAPAFPPRTCWAYRPLIAYRSGTTSYARLEIIRLRLKLEILEGNAPSTVPESSRDIYLSLHERSKPGWATDPLDAN